MQATLVIPTLNAAALLPGLLDAAAAQSAPPEGVLVIDSSSDDGTADLARARGCTVVTIDRAAFDHGATRALALDHCSTQAVLFMTQDALPADGQVFARLLGPLQHDPVAATYARQVARADATPPEAYLRLHNYPAQPQAARTAADIHRLGVRAFFLSNVAAAYRRDALEAVGRFPRHTIMNEDMLTAARLLRAGFAVQYVADACVLHSHRYRPGQHLRRYFDIGVFMTDHAEELGATPGGGEGLAFVKGQLRHVPASWWPRCVAEAGAKWVGYQLGRRYRSLPVRWRRALSMHKAHWR